MKKVNPFAVCRSVLGKKGPKYERCVMSIKKKQHMAKKRTPKKKHYKMPASVKRAAKIIEKEVTKLKREEGHHKTQLSTIQRQLKHLGGR